MFYRTYQPIQYIFTSLFFSSTMNDKLGRIFKAIDPIDLLVTLILLILFVVMMMTNKTINPLYVPENDSLSSFPYPGKSTVPTNMLYACSLGIPFAVAVIMFVLNLAFKNKFVKKMNIFAAIWVIVLDFLAVEIFTDVFKNYVGRPRPDIYARCGSTSAQYDTCTNIKESDRNDEWKSFPSGHSSISMSGMYIAASLFKGAMKFKNSSTAVIMLLFIFFALYVACSRIKDYRHHADDVVAGMFIGFVVASIVWENTYLRVFPEEETDNQNFQQVDSKRENLIQDGSI